MCGMLGLEAAMDYLVGMKEERFQTNEMEAPSSSPNRWNIISNFRLTLPLTSLMFFMRRVERKINH